MCCLPIDQLSRLIKDEPEWKRGYYDGCNNLSFDESGGELYVKGYTAGFGEYVREHLTE